LDVKLKRCGHEWKFPSLFLNCGQYMTNGHAQAILSSRPCQENNVPGVLPGAGPSWETGKAMACLTNFHGIFASSAGSSDDGNGVTGKVLRREGQRMVIGNRQAGFLPFRPAVPTKPSRR